MGYIRHDAVIATIYDRDRATPTSVWINSLALNDQHIFLCSDAPINGYVNIVMMPDGSKEGWTESNHYDVLRKQFLFFLKACGHWAEWVHVCYGHEDGCASIMETNCKQEEETDETI